MAMVITSLATGGRPSDQTAGSTTPIAPLGVLFQENPDTDSSQTTANDQGSGGRLWRYVKIESAGVVEGIVCVNSDGKGPGFANIHDHATVDLNPSRVVGVAQYTIASGSYGWLLVEGIGEVLADTGGITADTSLTPGNAVDVAADDATATNASFAVSTETVAAGALATCWISCKR